MAQPSKVLKGNKTLNLTSARQDVVTLCRRTVGCFAICPAECGINVCVSPTALKNGIAKSHIIHYMPR